jgi:DNA-directed RNA polymerase specialized sigma24 family protein
MTLDPLAANTHDEPAPISERRLVLSLTPRTGRGDTRSAMDDMDDARRRKVLADPALHKAILGIARQRGVPDSDASDVLNDVIEAACKDSNVPLEDFEQTRMYLNAMARHKSIDRTRARKKHMELHVEANEETPGADAATIEERVLASRLVEEGRNLYPRSHHWFERFAIFGESHAEIAADVKASPSRVRHEASDIRRTLRSVALAGVAALLVLAFGLHKWKRPGTENHDQLANSATGAPHTPSAPPSSAKPTPPPEAVALRERAREELARGQWDLCFADIIKAIDLDPSGATPEDTDIMRKANDKLNEREAKPRRP